MIPVFSEKGLVRIFRGPGNDHDLGPLTPLIAGWAFSRINLDPNQEPEDKWAWYYYPEGIVGEEVKDYFWIRARKEGMLFGEENRKG